MGRHKGFRHSEETKRKLSIAKKSINFSPKIKFEKGHYTSPETRKKISLSLIGKEKGMHNSPNTEFKKGRKISEEEKILRSERFRGSDNPYYGKKHTPEIREKMREKRRLHILPKKDTSIEIKIQNLLKQLGIEFFTHQYIKDIKHGYQCDIFIPEQEKEGIIINQKTIIECDGDYWHCNLEKFPNPNEWQLKQIEKDKVRTKELEEKGYRVIRLWENKIKNMQIEDINNKLKNN